MSTDCDSDGPSSLDANKPNEFSPATKFSPARVFEKRATYLEQVGFPFVVSKYNLYVLIGPTGAGKSTIEEELIGLDQGITPIRKEQTRPRRANLDSNRTAVEPAVFKGRQDAKVYIHSYDTQYQDSEGVTEVVQYGIPEVSVWEALRNTDALLTFTDPQSYFGFFADRVLSKLRGKANIIPILVTTSSSDCLFNRLNVRKCSIQEMNRRILQAEPQWKFYEKESRNLEHVILNDTPESLLNIPLRDTIPRIVETETYSRIDRMIAKVAGIVSFYRQLRQAYPVRSSSFDVHAQFMDFVLNAYFSNDLLGLAGHLDVGVPVALSPSQQTITRIKRELRAPFQVDHFLEKVKAVSYELSDGVLTIKFNDALRNNGFTEEGKKIFERMLPGYGWWGNPNAVECGKRRFALTDRHYTDLQYVHAVDMKIL